MRLIRARLLFSTLALTLCSTTILSVNKTRMKLKLKLIQSFFVNALNTIFFTIRELHYLVVCVLLLVDHYTRF